MNTKPKQPQKHKKLRIIAVVLLALLLAGCGVLLYKHHQKNQAIAKERAEYAQAEKDLDALSAQIIAKFGQPIANTTDKSCGYASSFDEFAPHGDLYCSDLRDFVYKQTDKSQAIEFASEVASVVRVNEIFRYGSSSTALANVNSTPLQIRSDSMTDRGGLSCSVISTFTLSSDPKSILKPADGPAGLELTFSCGSRPAKAVYFPLKNS